MKKKTTKKHAKKKASKQAKRKTLVRKARKTTSANDRTKKAIRKSKEKRPSKLVSKSVPKKLKQLERKPGSGKAIGKRTVSGRGKTKGVLKSTRVRRKEIIEFCFEGVRKVDKKIDLFKNSGKKDIQKQMKRRGGKPPRGFVVTVRDKKDREHTQKSPLDFVVNENSTLKFVSDMLTQMKENFMEWKDMQDEPQDDVDDNPYKDFNPDTIHCIEVRFIY